MKTYISLLRGINVGGNKKIPMQELKKIYEALGFTNVRTYIQSGNVIFESSDRNITKLIQKIEQKITQTFGFDVLVFIRTKDDLKKLIQKTPFSNQEPQKLYVTFLSDTLINPSLEAINKVKDPSEEFFIIDKEIYLFFPNGYGKTKLANNLFEKKLKVAATTRNWNTINKLISL